MSDTSERDAVLKEFSYLAPPSFLRGYREERMADEIVRLRQRLDRAERILAALREPSEAIDDAACEALPYGISIAPGIRAAVAAAEQEVGG